MENSPWTFLPDRAQLGVPEKRPWNSQKKTQKFFFSLLKRAIKARDCVAFAKPFQYF